LGKPFLNSDSLEARDIILQITDVGAPGAVGFYKNVLLVELGYMNGSSTVKVVAHPLKSWVDSLTEVSTDAEGSRRKRQKVIEKQDVNRCVALPFVLATGGNPTVRQGFYALPVYTVYEGSRPTTLGSLQTMPGNPDEVLRFVQSRAPYTVSWSPEREDLEEVARQVSGALPKPAGGSKKTMALIAMVDYRTGIFEHRSPGATIPRDFVDMGESVLYPGHRMVVNLQRVVERLWTAKVLEASEKGKLDDGECTFCGGTGLVVSSYAKGWPLFTTTYEFPLPAELKEEELVKSIALCEKCYSALVFGANMFTKTVKTVDRTLTRELFSPTQSGVGKVANRERKLDDIYGSCFILPVLDQFLQSERAREDFVVGYLARLTANERSKGVDVQLRNILGFEDRISEDLANDDYRLTAVYYRGNWSRGAVDLVAIIQDVVPSVARQLLGICRSTGDMAVDAAKAAALSWGSTSSDAKNAYYHACCSSLPYLLIQAYGGPYLWQTLDAVLHRRPLDHRAFVRNVSRRMMSLSKDLSQVDRARALESEVIFFVSFMSFLDEYVKKVVGEGGVPMLDWRLWTKTVESEDASQWEPGSTEELGFMVGALTRAFARQYYRVTNGRDFMKHRVMTFGADLKPKDIIHRGLARFSELARKLDMHLPTPLRKWASAATIKCLGMEDSLKRDSDVFVASFWAGYELCPANLFSTQEKVTEGAENGEDS
jgi:hypothetical protein